MRRLHLSILIAAAIVVNAADARLMAQGSTPRPNATITRIPELLQNVQAADINEDGIPDLVAGTPDGVMLIPGQGGGAYAAGHVIATGIAAPVLGDFDGDGHIDIAATSAVLPGRGDGTFDDPVPSGIRTSDIWNETADLNGDGHLDLVALVEPHVRVYAGDGRFGFAAPVSIFSVQPRSLTIADFNRDGWPDIAVAEAGLFRVQLLLNQGGLSFAESSITFGRATLGIGSHDWNADGNIDLLVTSAEQHIGVVSFWGSGFVHILRGNGDGTFQTPDAAETYLTNPGPRTLVTGDFNSDGLTDVATGNLSQGGSLTCDTVAPLWTSVSILPRLSDGRLGSAASFALGNSADDLAGPFAIYRHNHHLLTASDLNADGRIDLLASPGAILLNVPEAANNPPIADAGPHRTLPPGERFVLQGSATDPDGDWLSFRWTDERGRVVAEEPQPCLGPRTGIHPFTLTVDDGRGGVSSDVVTLTFYSAGLPAGWSGTSIGDAGGSTAFDGVLNWAVTGAGADIWGSADAFQFGHVAIAGDFQITALVSTVEAVHEWTKAGLMVREGLSESDRHAFVFATPTGTHGVNFQRRVLAGGPTLHTSGPSYNGPIGLRLRREGDEVYAFVDLRQGDPWVLIGAQTLPDLGSVLQVGLAVTSHEAGTPATATFENVVVEPLPPGSDAHPERNATDIGAVGAPGSTVLSGGAVFTVRGSGADIWGTSDAFHFASVPFDGDVTITARVLSIEAAHEWAKAGLMIREGLLPSDRHAFVFTTPAVNGVNFQRRIVEGDATLHTPGPRLNRPFWLRLERIGEVVTASHASDATGPWTVIDRQTITDLAARVYVGFAVSSHEAGTLAAATFDRLTVVAHSQVPTLPAGWGTTDVGSASRPGTAAFDGARFIVEGSGADIWDTADAFRFVYLRVPSDVTIVTRLTELNAPHEWAKAGLMVRTSLDASAAHHALFMTGANGLAYQRRTAAGGATLHTGLTAPSAPVWLAISRGGLGTVHLAYSVDGATWIPVATVPFSGGEILVGLAVTSHVDGSLATAIFDNVTLHWNAGVASEDIGTTAVSGNSSFDGRRFTISGNGSDIWGSEDAFHYSYRTLEGDGAIVARITSMSAPDEWGKAGLMIRGSTHPSAPHAFILASRDHGFAFQRRTASGGPTTHSDAGGGIPPRWLMLSRAGGLVTAWVSADATVWTEVGSDFLPEMATGPVLVGVAVTSHATGAVATATFEDLRVAD